MQAKGVDGAAASSAFDAGWESTRRRHLTLGLTVSPAERLRWLEEMLVIAHQSGALERRRRGKVSLYITKR
jgi:hypothetical protein